MVLFRKLVCTLHVARCIVLHAAGLIDNLVSFFRAYMQNEYKLPQLEFDLGSQIQYFVSNR